jgi:hypothetical protein
VDNYCSNRRGHGDKHAPIDDTERARLWSDLAGDLNLTAAELTPNKWGSQGEPPLVDLRRRFWLLKRARLFLLCVYIFHFDY